MTIEDVIKDIIKSDKLKIGFYEESTEWYIERVWSFGSSYFAEIKYNENGGIYTSTQAFDKSRIDSIIRDNKINNLLNGL
jgi:hypothetical protein